MGYGAILGVLGGLLGAGGSIGGGILSKPKNSKDTYFGLNPVQGIVSNLFGNPLVSGRGGLMSPSETPVIQNIINSAFARGATPEQISQLIRGGFSGTGQDSLTGGLDGGTRGSPIAGFEDILAGAGLYSKDPLTGAVFDARPYLPASFGFQYADPMDPARIRGATADFFNPTALNPAQQSAIGLANQGGMNFPTTQDLFANTLIPGARELATTGFRTNLDPIRANEEFQFFNRTAPGIAAAYGGATGGLSSEFGANLLRELGGLHYGLGALQSQADEAAAARRAQGLSQGGLLGTVFAGLPNAQAAQGLNIGGQIRDLETSLRPGASFYNALGSLLGLAGGNPLQGQNMSYNIPGNQGLSDFANAFNQTAAGNFANLFKPSIRQDPTGGVNQPGSTFNPYISPGNSAYQGTPLPSFDISGWAG